MEKGKIVSIMVINILRYIWVVSRFDTKLNSIIRILCVSRDGTKYIQNGVVATPKTYNILVILYMYVVFLYMCLMSAPVPITKKYSVRP
jgi:hypothetical protein